MKTIKWFNNIINLIFQGLGSFQPELQGSKQKIAEDKKILERIIKCARDAAASCSENLVKASLGLLEKIISLHGLGQEEALQCAWNYMTIFRSRDMSDAVFVLNALIDRDFELEKIALIAYKAACDTAYPVCRNLGVQLFIKLMSKNSGIEQAIEAYLCLMSRYNRGLYQDEKDFLRSEFWPSIFNCIGMQNDETLNKAYFEILYAKFKEFYDKNKHIASIQEPIKIIIADIKQSQSGYVQERIKQLEQPEQLEPDTWTCVIS